MFRCLNLFLRPACGAKYCVIFMLSFSCFCTIFRARFPMKIYAQKDLLSKWQDIFDVVLIMHQPKIFSRFASWWLITMNFSLFWRKSFIRKKWDVISHTAGIYFCRKQKLEFILTFRNAGNAVVIVVNVNSYWHCPYRDALLFNF